MPIPYDTPFPKLHLRYSGFAHHQHPINHFICVGLWMDDVMSCALLLFPDTYWPTQPGVMLLERDLISWVRHHRTTSLLILVCCGPQVFGSSLVTSLLCWPQGSVAESEGAHQQINVCGMACRGFICLCWSDLDILMHLLQAMWAPTTLMWPCIPAVENLLDGMIDPLDEYGRRTNGSPRSTGTQRVVVKIPPCTGANADDYS